VRLHRDAKVELIAGVPLFERCSKRELAAIANIADQIERPEGRVVVHEGELGQEFWVLVEGNAEVPRHGARVATLGPGDFFGEIALVSNRPRTATVTATSPMRLLVVTDRAFRELMRKMPSIQSKVLAALAERVPADDDGN